MKIVNEVTPVNPEPGEIYIINGKAYGICIRCRKWVRVDKFLFGSLHVCR